MCFSLEADLVVGVALLPVAAVSLREVRHVREVPFAALPLLFSLHQFIEAVVWAGVDGHVSAGVQQVAAMAYLIIAFPLLPILFPLSVLLLEPRGARLRVAPFVALGAVVSTYFALAVLTGPIRVVAHPRALAYVAELENGVQWTGLYVIAVIGPSLLSGYRSLVAFGVLNLIGLSTVALVYAEAFTSIWCVYAALTSVFIAAHMVLRRRLPDSDRLQGHATVVHARP